MDAQRSVFHVTHGQTGERRGVGGIFFDDLDDRPLEEIFAFVSDAAGALNECYCPIG